MGLLSDLIGNILIFIPIAIAGIGIGFTFLIVVYFVSELWDALYAVRASLQKGFGFTTFFSFLAGVFIFIVEILKSIIELLTAVIEMIPIIFNSINCFWNSDPESLGIINIAMEIFVEYFPVIYYIMLLIPMYLMLYYLGEVSDVFL